jgi:hypothetical protein
MHSTFIPGDVHLVQNQLHSGVLLLNSSHGYASAAVHACCRYLLCAHHCYYYYRCYIAAATHTLQSEGGRLTEVQALELGALVEKRVAEMKSAVLDETSRAVNRALAAKADTMALNKVLTSL